MTAGEAIGPICEAVTPDGIRSAFRRYVDHLIGEGYGAGEADALACVNVAYYVGYYQPDVGARVRAALGSP